jgi:elongator complex protein 4
MGGLEWNDMTSLNDDLSIQLCHFLFSMREMLRHSLATCIVTIPNELAQNSNLLEQFTHLSDYVFLMDDSAQTMARLATTQYSGLFRLLKLPRLNSLSACFMPETLDLAFHIKHKRLVIEQMHLPPDLGEDDDSHKGRTNTSVMASITDSKKQTGCGTGTGGSSKLDF